MKKFETPEIKVVIFKTNEVISTSIGYEGSPDDVVISGHSSYGSASQPTMEIPF